MLTRVLSRHLGRVRAARALAAFVWRARRDPLRDLPRTWDDTQETLSREQLAPVFHIDDIARDVLGLDDDARMALLADMVGDTGARFVAQNVPEISPEEWSVASDEDRKRFARGLGGRLFNAKLTVLRVHGDGLDIDVTACRFVELCRAAGRQYLAPLFCEADSRHFDRPDSAIALKREGTLARGAERCDFRFRLRTCD
jgi:hypothetical protein